jgi:Ig-like domain-containing protein
VTPNHAGTYYVDVISGCAQRSSDDAELTVLDWPEIVTHPDETLLCVGDTVEFTLEAAGIEPLSNQWQFDGTNIPGATGSTYVINEVASGDFGDYRCIVTDGCGNGIVSQTAELAFDVVIFELQPVGGTFCVGDAIFLFASASGFPEYQWFKDGKPILGATTQFLAFTNASVEDSGAYHVSAVNECNSAHTSSTAAVFVEPCSVGP